MEPILAAPLLRPLEDQLLALLSSLTLEHWVQPTIVPGWQVRHVAGHLLDTALRKLSLVRDGFAPLRPASFDAAGILAFVNQRNAAGADVFGALSPAALTALLRPVSAEMCAFHEQLDPFAPAAFAVSWAGETASLNWFDTARELTERWHHQQQIRLALHRPGLFTRELYHPVLDCFLRALPYAFRNQEAPAGAHVRVTITGAAGGDWFLARRESAWELTASPAGACVAAAAIPEEIAWRVFTKGIALDQALPLVELSGHRPLALHVLRTVAIVG